MIQNLHLQDFSAVQGYLLQKTQHAIGGFGKLCGDPPGNDSKESLSEIAIYSHSSRHPPFVPRVGSIGHHATAGFEKH